jgi:hypothetical protein
MRTDFPEGKLTFLCILQLLSAAVMLSVVHTGLTVVSSDISSGFTSSKRKVFVEQTVCTHFSFHSRIMHLDIIKDFTPNDAHVFLKEY